MANLSVQLTQDDGTVTVNKIARRSEPKYRFAIIPKFLGGSFFPVVQRGCIARAKKLGNVECVYVGTDGPDGGGQAQIIRSLVLSGKVDGIAVSIAQRDSRLTNEAIQFGIQAGVPVVTFESDAVDSERLSYIGTNDYSFGQALGKVLLKIDPTGGNYGVITGKVRRK